MRSALTQATASCYESHAMTTTRPRTLYELLLLSDFGRANPDRVRELLDSCADPVTEDRNERRERELDTAA